MALCKLYTRYTVGQEGEISTNFFHNKLAGFGPGNCYLTFRAANHLNTSEHVLLKVGLSCLRKCFVKLKFSLALFEKILSFACLVFKIEKN